MKVKATLLIGKIVKTLHISDPRYFQLYLCDEMTFPHAYISTKDEKETVNNIISKYFHIDPSWLNVEVTGFRKTDSSEAEVVYTIIMPEVSGCNKSGNFFSYKEIQKLDIEIDKYYEPLISRRSPQL
jgi:hypothetical protein